MPLLRAARKGVFEIEQSLGAIDPKECTAA